MSSFLDSPLHKTLTAWAELDKALAPCPFCGQAAYSVPVEGATVAVRCGGGGCSASVVSAYGRDGAVAQWNARADVGRRT